MKKLILILCGVPAAAVAQPMSAVDIRDTLYTLDTAVRCENGHQVLTPTFHRLTSTIFTKLVPDITGDIRNGSAFTLNVNDDKTLATVKGTVPAGPYSGTFFNIGARSAIKSNIGEVFSGKSGLSTDWGFSGGATRIVRKGMFYTGNACAQYRAGRRQYIQKLCADYGRYAGLGNVSRENTSYLQTGLLPDSTLKSAAICDKEAADAFAQETTDTLVADSIAQERGDFFLDKVVDWELKNASWTGHWFLFLNGRLDYDSRGYVSYDPTRPLLADRLQDLQFNQWRASVSVSYIRNTRRFYLFADLAGYWKTDNAYEDPANKKYKKDYVTESGLAADSVTTQYSSQTKSAFDGSKLSFKDFQVWGADLQATAFFGKPKTVGINLALNYAHSAGYETNNRLSLGMGPVISIAAGEKEEVAKTNFGTLVGWNDLLNPNLKRDERLFVRFFINIPVRLFGTGK